MSYRKLELPKVAPHHLDIAAKPTDIVVNAGSIKTIKVPCYYRKRATPGTFDEDTFEPIDFETEGYTSASLVIDSAVVTGAATIDSTTTGLIKVKIDSDDLDEGEHPYAVRVSGTNKEDVVLTGKIHVMEDDREAADE